MKRCMLCDHTFDHAGWVCPACGATPATIESFVAFAPELAVDNDGMAPDAHHRLSRITEESFWFRARNRLIEGLVVRYFPDAGSVLEIGCGTGHTMQALRRALPSARMAGSDIHSTGLAYTARRVGPAIELLQMDASNIPFDSEFDLICAFDVLEHVDDDRRALGEIARALRPRGGILLSVPQHPFLWSSADEIGRHRRRYRRAELADKCRAAGFEVVRDTSFTTLLLPVMYLQRLQADWRPGYHPADEFDLPGWLDRSLFAVLDIERRAIGAGLSLPVGGSRFVAARRAR